MISSYQHENVDSSGTAAKQFFILYPSAPRFQLVQRFSLKNSFLDLIGRKCCGAVQLCIGSAICPPCAHGAGVGGDRKIEYPIAIF